MCEPLRSFVVAASVHCQPFFVTASCSDLVWLTICIRAATLCDRYKHPCFACGGDFGLGW